MLRILTGMHACMVRMHKGRMQCCISIHACIILMAAYWATDPTHCCITCLLLAVYGAWMGCGAHMSMCMQEDIQMSETATQSRSGCSDFPDYYPTSACTDSSGSQSPTHDSHSQPTGSVIPSECIACMPVHGGRRLCLQCSIPMQCRRIWAGHAQVYSLVRTPSLLV